jgi:outer membrane protein assembly complex protein YaeT
LRQTAPLLLGLLLIASTAAADDLGGAYRGLLVDKVVIEGLESSLRRDLHGGLALTERTGFLGLRRIPYAPRLLEGDLARARLFLARQGYPFSTVESELIPNDESTALRVVLHIDSGPAVRVGRIDVLGTSIADSPEDREAVLGMSEGRVFTDLLAERSRQRLLTHLLEQGHARAEVELDVEVVDSTNVTVRLVAEPGGKWEFGDVVVKGVGEGFHDVVNRAANIRNGEPFHPRTVRDATDDIRALRLFRRVKVELVPVDERTMDFVCELSERDHRSVEFGVGYMTDDGLLGRAMWEHRNLFGGGRGFRVLGSATQYRQMAESSVTFPAMFRSPTTGIGSVGYERRVEPAYDSEDFRVSYFLAWRYNRRGRITSGPLVQVIDVRETGDDPDIPRELRDANGPVSSLIVDWQYDSSDDPLFPSKGFRIGWDHQIAPPGLGSVSKFYRMGASVAGYRRVHQSVILAARASTGIGWPMADSEGLLINYRYFAGGSNSHRGYERERLGPKDLDDNPQGGELAVLGAAEVRFPLWKLVEASLFLDGGQVWFDKSNVRISDLSWAVGPGLAIRTPVGPIRFDYGIRINPPDDGEPKRVFHFAIGYAF